MNSDAPSYHRYRFPPAIIGHSVRLRRGRLGDTWHLDELFVTIQGQRQHLLTVPKMELFD